jgi:hypothetical protein
MVWPGESRGGTPVLWKAWSVSSGRLWQVTHWPLPIKTRSPFTSCVVNSRWPLASFAAIARA